MMAKRLVSNFPAPTRVLLNIYLFMNSFGVRCLLSVGWDGSMFVLGSLLPTFLSVQAWKSTPARLGNDEGLDNGRKLPVDYGPNWKCVSCVAEILIYTRVKVRNLSQSAHSGKSEIGN